MAKSRLRATRRVVQSDGKATVADVLIRRYRAADAPAVQRLAPDAPPLQEVIEAGGDAWVAERQGQLLAYACATPLPGLPGQFDLQGYVTAAERREGLGSRLLLALLSALGEQGAQEIACAVERLESPAARFLQAHGFTLHHEEWRMTLEALDRLPPAADVPGCRARTLPRRRAISAFLRLYDASFAGAPWY
ncbi:MAG: GNAT family N-acetyltransferase, partial [Chloroflexota bacterium]